MSLIPAFEIGIWNAWIFMSVFIIQMLTIFVLGKRVWGRSSLPSDFERSKREAITSIVGNAVWFLATIYSIFLPFRLGTSWFYVGLVIFLVGLIILTIATINFVKAPMENPITRWMYRISRHPLYLSLFIIYIGTSVATASWVFFLLSVANIYWIWTESIAEERYCLERYGKEYEEYMNKTSKWIGVPKY